jgi:hypothetical protein
MIITIKDLMYKKSSDSSFDISDVNVIGNQEISFAEIFEFTDTSVFQFKRNITLIEDIIFSDNDIIRFTNDTYFEFTQISSSNLVIDGSGYVIEREDAFKNPMFKVIYESNIDVTVKNIGIYGTYDSKDSGSSDHSELLLMTKSGTVSTTANVNIQTCFLDGFSWTKSPFLSGKYDKVTISDCFSKCILKENNGSGFLALDTSGVDCKIERSFFAGEFTPGQHAAGFIDISAIDEVSVIIKECYSMCDISNDYNSYKQSSFVSICSNASSTIGVAVENCYSIPKTNDNSSNSKSIINDGSATINVNKFYTLYNEIFSNTSNGSVSTTNTYKNSNISSIYAKSQPEIDASLSNLFLVDDLGIIKGYPLLKCFTDANGVWEPSIYQNFNSETRQKVFVDRQSFNKLFDNSTLVDSDFNSIDNVHSFSFSGTDTTLRLLNDVSDITYKFTIHLHNANEKYSFNDISFDIISNSNYLNIKTTDLTTDIQSTVIQNNDTLKEIYSSVNTLFHLPIGTYEIDIDTGLYLAFEDASSNTGKDKDHFVYTGSSRSLEEVSTRIHTKDANGNEIDSMLSYYTGRVYLNVKDETSIYLHYYTIDDVGSRMGFVDKTKFQITNDSEKINNLTRDKFYTISYYGTQLDNILSDTDTSYNRVRKAEIQMRSKLFQTFVEIMKLRGVQEFKIVIDLLIKERRFVNPDLTDGVDYNLLDVLMGNFPDEFIIYKYTTFDVIQEMIKSKNDPLTQKEVYYLRDLIRIYSKDYRIYSDSLKRTINYPDDVNNQLKNLMNDSEFRPENNIYTDICYTNIDTVENLKVYSERLKLFECLYDQEINSFLQRTNTTNISNLQLYYPPIKDIEINQIINRDIYDVLPKIRFQDYNPNYIFFKDISSTLFHYNTRKRLELQPYLEKTGFVTDVSTSFVGKKMKWVTPSDNGQFLFAILNNDYKVFEISDNDLQYKNGNISIPFTSTSKPDIDKIERVYLSNDGQKVFMYTSTNIYLHTLSGDAWTTKDKSNSTPAINGTILFAFMNNDGSKIGVIVDDVTINNNVFMEFNVTSSEVTQNDRYYIMPINNGYYYYIYNSKMDTLYVKSYYALWKYSNANDYTQITPRHAKSNLYLSTHYNIIKSVSYDNHILFLEERASICKVYLSKVVQINNPDYSYWESTWGWMVWRTNPYNPKRNILKRREITIEDEIILEGFINDNDRFDMDLIIDNSYAYMSFGFSNFKEGSLKSKGIQYIYRVKLSSDDDIFDYKTLQLIYKSKGAVDKTIGHRTKLGGIYENNLYTQVTRYDPNNYENTSELVIHNISDNTTEIFTNKSI